MPSILAASLSWPTPIATFLSSLGTVGLFLLLYLVLGWLRSGRETEEPRWFDAFLGYLRVLDRGSVRIGSWITGTRYEHPLVRRALVLTVFAVLALIGAALPWPWGLIVITAGVLGIFIVFRHWSLDEDEALREIKFEDKDIKIRGDLSLEVTIACAFILVFAPVAFAHIAAAGLGFQIKPEAGAFAFLIYALIELAKAGSIVDYYDLFSNQLPFERISEVASSGAWARGAVLSYRLALNLLLLAALKRLFDIARRRAEGSDLRHLEEMLREQGVDAHAVIKQLNSFALRGRANAVLLLERILVPSKSDEWDFGPDVRYAAADALQDYADRQGGTGALYSAIAGYRRLLAENLNRSEHPQLWAMAQHALGNALQRLGSWEASPTRLEESIAAYRAALEIRTRDAAPNEWAATQVTLGLALANLGSRDSSGDRLREAVAAYCAALEVYTRDATPDDWAVTQGNMGSALHTLAEREGDLDVLQAAITAHRSALEVRQRDTTPSDWAINQHNLALALHSLGDRDRNAATLKEAVAAYRSALEVRTREAMPNEWAITQHNLASALQSLAEVEDGEAHLDEAVAIFREIVRVRSRESMPTQWADTLNNLGIALARYGDRDGNVGKLEEAVSSFRAAAEIWTRDKAPASWASTQNNLGLSLTSLGKMQNSRQQLKEAVTALCAALEVRTRDAMPADRAITLHNLGMALAALDEQEKDSHWAEDAVSAFRSALELCTPEDMPVLWSGTQNNLGVMLEAIGERKRSITHVKEAVTAYRSALKVRTRDAMPSAWATTQGHLARAQRLLDLVGQGQAPTKRRN